MDFDLVVAPMQALRSCNKAGTARYCRINSLFHLPSSKSPMHERIQPVVGEPRVLILAFSGIEEK